VESLEATQIFCHSFGLGNNCNIRGERDKHDWPNQRVPFLIKNISQACPCLLHFAHVAGVLGIWGGGGTRLSRVGQNRK
jgi:hypothetical protein